MPFAGEAFLTMTYQRPAGSIVRTDLRHEHRRSTDLETWSEAGVTVVSVSAPDPVTELETVVVRSSTPVGNGGLLREFPDLLVSF
jgi:hypothetical protein